MLASPARNGRSAALACLFCAASLAASSARADLSGRWLLDEEQSDVPSEVVEKAEQGRGRNRAARLTPQSIVVFGVSIPVGRSGKEEPDEPPPERRRIDETLGKSDYVLFWIDELTIAHDARFADFVYGDKVRIVTYENGAEHETGYSTVVPKWSGNGNRVVIEHALDGGGKITETYTLDGAQLRWDVRVEKEDYKTVRIARVYERARAANELRFTAVR